MAAAFTAKRNELLALFEQAYVPMTSMHQERETVLSRIMAGGNPQEVLMDAARHAIVCQTKLTGNRAFESQTAALAAALKEMK